MFNPLDLFPKEIRAHFEQLPAFIEDWRRFMAAWTDFMSKLGRKLDYIEAKLEGVDNRLAYVSGEVDDANTRLVALVTESNLTPDLHAQVLGMAESDPRNHRQFHDAIELLSPPQ